MIYRLIFDWNHWQESLVMYTRAELIKWLNSGFIPRDCKVFIEKDGKRHEWGRKPSLAGGRSKEFDKLLAAQAEDDMQWKNYIDGCAANKVRMKETA